MRNIVLLSITILLLWGVHSEARAALGHDATATCKAFEGQALAELKQTALPSGVVLEARRAFEAADGLRREITTGTPRHNATHRAELKKITGALENFSSLLLGKINQLTRLIDQAKAACPTRKIAHMFRLFRSKVAQRWQAAHSEVERNRAFLEFRLVRTASR